MIKYTGHSKYKYMKYTKNRWKCCHPHHQTQHQLNKQKYCYFIHHVLLRYHHQIQVHLKRYRFICNQTVYLESNAPISQTITNQTVKNRNNDQWNHNNNQYNINMMIISMELNYIVNINNDNNNKTYCK